MTMRVRWMCCCLALGVVVSSAPQIAAAEGAAGTPAPFIGGTTPDRRPEGAPQISKFEKTDAWYAKARTGVSQPYPASLKFLDDQGGWFNPFTHAGMPGPYDIRGWHAAGGKPAQAH